MNYDQKSVVRDQFICCATFIPLRKWQYVLPFLWFTKKTERELKSLPGVIKSEIHSDINILGLIFPKFRSLDGRYFQKRFWTFTVWQDRESSRNFFVSSTPHREAVKHFKEWTYPTARIAIWPSDSSKIDWETGQEKWRESPGIKDYYAEREIDIQDYVPGQGC